MSTKPPVKKATETQTKKAREQAPPSATIIAVKLTVGENHGETAHSDIVDVVPFGHRQSDELDAMRWGQRRGYITVSVPAGVSLRDHLAAEDLL